MVSEGDTITFDTSDTSMAGKGFSFGTANDGSASITTGVTDAGTAGTSGASTTLVVSTGTAADGSTTELYIFAADAADTPVISIDVNDNKTIYESTENFAWGGGSETTFFVNGNVIGYAESYSDAGMPGVERLLMRVSHSMMLRTTGLVIGGQMIMVQVPTSA